MIVPFVTPEMNSSSFFLVSRSMVRILSLPDSSGEVAPVVALS